MIFFCPARLRTASRPPSFWPTGKHETSGKACASRALHSCWNRFSVRRSYRHLSEDPPRWVGIVELQLQVFGVETPRFSQIASAQERNDPPRGGRLLAADD